MASDSMKVSEIIAAYERSRQDKRVPYKPRRRQDDFKVIFEEKCKEVKDGTSVLYPKN